MDELDSASQPMRDQSQPPLATSAQASTTPVSTVSIVPPRRNAAAKASRQLHETTMPDVIEQGKAERQLFWHVCP